MSFKRHDIIFLIGAGCSFDAGIPTTDKMIQKIENDLLSHDNEWTNFKSLYHFIKSSILYSEGIFGDYSNNISIEKFVNVLSELEKKERNIVYPFIANWNNRLIDLAGQDFMNIKQLKTMITQNLIEWMKVGDYNQKASYYKHFYSFQKELGVALRIFSLNYDLCFERLKPNEFNLELGFGEDKIWNSLKFEDNPDIGADIYLYKLHGSINWVRNKEKGNILNLSDDIEKEPDLIFGTDTKLQSIDPYLFYVYEFRKYSLSCKLIIIIGYSFSDSYINNLISQALQHDPLRKIICIAPNYAENHIEKIKTKLNLKNNTQIIQIGETAKNYLESDLTIKELSKYIEKPEEIIF